jgi:F0F1-type ATP synthase assembly protein I
MTDEKNSVWWQKSVEIFSRLSVWIAAPVIIGSFLGKWLDKKFNTEPFLFIATMGVMFILSMFGLIKETMKEFKSLDKKDENKK